MNYANYSDTLRQIGVYPASRSEFGSHLLSLPKVRSENITQHFGDAFEGQEQDDYSDSHVFWTGGHLCMLYMANGVWRFGTTEHGRNDWRLLDQLEKLKKVLEA